MATKDALPAIRIFLTRSKSPAILTDLKLDDSTIAAALLHDTIEDTAATRAEIDQLFGPDIGHLVEGLTKLKKLDLVTKEAKQAENLRKLLLAIADDVRVLLVKLADRLHNMRTLDYMPHCGAPRAPPRRPSKSMRRSPAAWACTRCARSSRIWPSVSSIRKPIRWSPRGSTRSPTATCNLISEIEQQLTRKLADRGIEARRRRPRASAPIRSGARWSASRSASSNSPTFSASASSSKTLADCYQALGIVHTTWPMVPGRFKDYISTPESRTTIVRCTPR